MVWIRFCALLCCLVLCSSCKNACSQDAKASQAKRHLRLAISEEPVSMDPRRGGDVLSSHLQFFLLEGLVALQPDGSVSPAQSHSYTLSQDKKTYTFYLGKTRWSDGSFVTAHDFERTWKSLLHPSFPSPNAHLFYSIRQAKAAKMGFVPLEDIGIRAIDANTLVVELEHPVPYFLELISFCTFFPSPPEHNSLLSNGPFILHSSAPGKEIVLKKNRFYRLRKKDPVEMITFSLIESDATAIQLYRKGEIDLLGDPFSRLSQELLPRIPIEDLFSVPISATFLVTFNTARFPFSNEKLRKAFHLAICREELVNNVMNPADRIAHSLVPPSLKKGLDKVFFSDQTTEKANQYLQEGLKELQLSKQELSSHLLYLYADNPIHKRIAQVLQQQWQKTLHIHVPIQTQDTATLLSHLSQKEYCFAQTLCRAQYLDPTSILERFSHKETAKNYPSWENESFQLLLTSSYFAEGRKRLEILDQAEQILLEEVPVSPLAHTHLLYAKKQYLQNIELSPAGGIFFERLCFIDP